MMRGVTCAINKQDIITFAMHVNAELCMLMRNKFNGMFDKGSARHRFDQYFIGCQSDRIFRKQFLILT